MEAVMGRPAPRGKLYRQAARAPAPTRDMRGATGAAGRDGAPC